MRLLAHSINFWLILKKKLKCVTSLLSNSSDIKLPAVRECSGRMADVDLYAIESEKK